MDNCLLCQRELSQPISINWLLSFKMITKPVICDECANEFIKLMNDEVCSGCNKANIVSDLCDDCKEWQLKMDFPFINRSLYQYNSAMKAFMHRYKFVGDYRLRYVFIKSFSRLVQAQKRLIIPIPIHPTTFEQRAFNQTTGLLNVEWIEALATIRKTKRVDQSKRTREQRKMIEQPFYIVESFRHKLVGQDIVIVDDVYTTGTTIRLAAKLLMDSGAKSVIGVTLAR